MQPNKAKQNLHSSHYPVDILDEIFGEASVPLWKHILLVRSSVSPGQSIYDLCKRYFRKMEWTRL